MTAGQDLKIIKDLGLAATSLFGLFIAVFVGHRPRLEGSRAPQRLQPARQAGAAAELVLGKYLGLAITLLVNVSVMAARPLRCCSRSCSWTSPESLRAGVGGASRRSRRC